MRRLARGTIHDGGKNENKVDVQVRAKAEAEGRDRAEATKAKAEAYREAEEVGRCTSSEGAAAAG